MSPMFQKIRYRLLLSYLLVFGLLLGGFAILVRIVFAHSLTGHLKDQLTDLAQTAAIVEYENGHYRIDKDFSVQDLIFRHQALQWFDVQGRLQEQQGKAVLNLPLSVSKNLQFTTGENRIQAITLPIISENSRLIGYVRASQSLEELDETLNKLDWGLGGGIVVALALSGVGGIWLTRQAMQPIEESFQRLKQFTADASHELRSPLMAIKSNAAVALKYPEGIRTTDIQKFNAIISATSQMTRLTEDLLFLARNDKIRSGNKNAVDLTVILRTLLQQYQPQSEAKQINLQSELVANLYVLGDSVELSRLFSNLIENALSYTPNGGRVEIKTSRVGSYIYVNVQDTGIGIESENIEKVFERFWRADQSRSYHSSGSGLGLAIAQAIAQNHSGLITVTSQLKVGSCFSVRFLTHLQT